MKRLDFLKSAFSVIAGSSVFGIDKLTSKSTKLITTNIAGLQYYHGIENLSNFKINDKVQLKRESENIHDKYAIAVYWNNLKIGFIPRNNNKVLANLIDSRKILHSEIKYINADSSLWNKVFVIVFLVE